MSSKKRIKVENEMNTKIGVKNNGLKRSVGRPKKSLQSSDGSLHKRKKSSKSSETQSQIIFTFKEKKAFYECLTENGFSVIHNKNVLLKSLPNRSLNQINSMIETYSRRGQELNKRNEENVDLEGNSDKQPIEKWYDLIHQTIPNPSKKDDFSVIFAQIFDDLAKHCDKSCTSSASSSQMTVNYSKIYYYISETLQGKSPPELEPIDAFIVLKLIEELKELFKSDDYDTERLFIESAKWWTNCLKPNENYYNAIHNKRQQESKNSSDDKEKLNENNTQINELLEIESTSGQSSRTRSRDAKVNRNKIEENGETSKNIFHKIEENGGQNLSFVLNFPKLRKIVDCLNPIQVPIELSKEEFTRWQK